MINQNFKILEDWRRDSPASRTMTKGGERKKERVTFWGIERLWTSRSIV